MSDFKYLEGVDLEGYGDFVEEDRQSYPTMGYSAREGQFFITAGGIDTPSKKWKLSEDGENYLAKGVKIAVLAKRQRASVTDGNYAKHFYPIFTRKNDMAQGKYRQHMQLLVMIDGANTLYSFGMNSNTPQKCLTQEEGNSPYNVKTVGDGSLTTLSKLLKEAKAEGHVLPSFAFWLPIVASAKLKTTMGSAHASSEVIPFVLAKPPEFVGKDRLAAHKQAAIDADLKAWRAEWSKAETEQPSTPEPEEVPGFDDALGEEFI